MWTLSSPHVLDGFFKLNFLRILKLTADSKV